jgi:lipopolysaccharide transport system permease protein
VNDPTQTTNRPGDESDRVTRRGATGVRATANVRDEAAEERAEAKARASAKLKAENAAERAARKDAEQQMRVAHKVAIKSALAEVPEAERKAFRAKAARELEARITEAAAERAVRQAEEKAAEARAVRKTEEDAEALSVQEAHEAAKARAAQKLDEDAAELREGGVAPLPPPQSRRPPKAEVEHKPLRRLGLCMVSVRTHLAMAGHFGHNYVKKYYMDTFLGWLWLPLRPLADVVLRSVLFGSLLQVASGGQPYLLFLTVGSVGWMFFERATFWGYRSLQYNYRYYRAIPVPWLPAITGTAVPGALQAFLYFLIALGIGVYYLITDGQFYLTFGVDTLYVLLGLALLLLYAWMLGLVLGPMVRVVRDVRLLIPYPIMLWYVLTPVVYTVDAMPQQYQAIAIYNPLTAPIEFVRHGLLGMGLPGQTSILSSVCVLAALTPIAVLLFARAERSSHVRL